MEITAATRRISLILGAAVFFATFLLGLAQCWWEQGTLPHVGEDSLAQAKRSVERGDLASGIAQLRMYARIEPRRPDGWVRLGQVLAATGDRDGAIDAFERSLDLPPVSMLVHQQLAGLYLQAGRVDDARTQARIMRDRGAQLPLPLLQLVRDAPEASR